MRAHGGPEIKHPECQACWHLVITGVWLLPRGQVLEGTGLRQRRARKSQAYGSGSQAGPLIWVGSCEHRAQDQMDAGKWIGNSESGLTGSPCHQWGHLPIEP